MYDGHTEIVPLCVQIFKTIKNICRYSLYGENEPSTDYCCITKFLSDRFYYIYKTRLFYSKKGNGSWRHPRIYQDFFNSIAEYPRSAKSITLGRKFIHPVGTNPQTDGAGHEGALQSAGTRSPRRLRSPSIGGY